MAVTLDSKIEFKKLCDLFEKVTNVKGSQKYQELQKFTQKCRTLASEIKVKYPDTDISLFPVFRLILPKLERDRGPYGLQVKNLNSLYIRVFCLGKNSANAEKLTSNKKLFNAASKNDDLGERIYWLLRNRLQDEKSSLTIQNVNEFLDSVAECHEKNQNKNEIFMHFMRKITALELKWLTRILLKDLKLGMTQSKAFEVLHPEAEALFNVTSSLRRVCERFAETPGSEAAETAPVTIELFSHVKPMLLERFKIEDIGRLFTEGSQYYVQTKFDGERSQLHVSAGRFRYFTRQGFDITGNASFGENAESGGFLSRNIKPLLSGDCRSLILDGELMGWHKERQCFGSKGLSYDVKKLTEHSKHQPCFVAYDILLYNNESLLNKTYSERLSCLRTAFSEKEGVLMLCKHNLVSKVDQIRELFNVALDNDDEGIVLKQHNVLYKPNVRERSGCYKIKAEYSDGLVHDLDLIILGGYFGKGRCSGIVNSFLVGVANTSNSKSGLPTEFFAVVSVRSGLSDEDMRTIQQQLKPHWRDKKPAGVFGPKSQPPDVWVSPKQSLILEIRASEIIRTQAYPPLNYSLRFPRVLKLRLDKSWDDACSTTEFMSLVKDRGGVQKMTRTRRVRPEDIDQVGSDDDEAVASTSLAKVRRTRNARAVHEAFLASRATEEESVVRASRLFDGYEFCLINGSAELSRQNATALLLSHSAKLVSNPGPNTFCVLVGEPDTLKAQNMISSEKYNVVSLTWLKRATSTENLSMIREFRPWELFSASPETRRLINEMYDEYWDSYVEDAQEETLRHAMEKAKQSFKTDTQLSTLEMKKLDSILFDDHISPFSVFRGKSGYFHDQDDIKKYSFTFMNGAIFEEFTKNVDYVFIGDDIPMEVAESYKNKEENDKCQFIVLKSEWISDCFAKQRLLSTENYVI